MNVRLLSVALGLLATVSGNPTVLYRRGGCNSSNGQISLFTGPIDNGCVWYSPGVFPNNNPAGGYIVTGLAPGQTAQIGQQAPVLGVGCGTLVGQFAQDGCYDLPDLANDVTISTCRTGFDCVEMIGERIVRKPVRTVRRDSRDRIEKKKRMPSEDTSADISPRQQSTFNVPNSCRRGSGSHTPACPSQFTSVAVCVNCPQNFGRAVRAGPDIRCPSGGSPCPVAFVDSVTVTNSISLDFGVTGNVGDSGTTGNAGISIGFGISHSVATTHGTSFGLSIPAGTSGFVQFEPAARVGTVVTLPRANVVNHETICNGDALICGSGVGSVIVSSSDLDGRYSVVKTG